MNWLEISIVVDAESAEAAAEVLSRYAPNAVAIEQRARDIDTGPEWTADGPLDDQVTVRAYLPIDAELDARRRQAEEALWHLRQIVPMPEPAFREIAPRDWENAWKEHYHVLRVGSRFVVKPSWRKHDAQPGDVVIELDPGMAFGTGLHPTTQMCLQAIETHMPAGARVLDLGTGSGILAVAAAKRGAASVLALDTDPIAVESARDNARRNGVESVVRVEAGSLESLRPITNAPSLSTWGAGIATFDFALVNILAKIIIQLCTDGLAEKVNPGGLAVFAGLIDTQESEVRESLERVGLSVIERVQDKDWVGLIARRE